MAESELHALVLVDAQAELAADVVDVRVEQVALAGFRGDAVAMGVVGSADVTGAEVERIVERPQGAGEVLLELAAEAIAAQPGQRRGGAEAGFRAVLAAGRTGGAAAVDGAAATDDLDPLDQRRVDVGQVARGVAVGVQRHAVDHHQHAAPAQGLAVFGDGAAGIGHPRHRLGQHGGQAVGALAQLLQLGMLDDGGLARGGDQVAAGARGGDFHLLHVQRFAAGLRSGHGGFAGRNDDEGMFVPGLRLQAAIPEQLAQCLFGGETPLQRGRLAAGAEIAGEKDLYRGLLREGVDRLAERRGGQIHVELFLALGRHRQEQAAGEQ